MNGLSRGLLHHPHLAVKRIRRKGIGAHSKALRAKIGDSQTYRAQALGHHLQAAPALGRGHFHGSFIPASRLGEIGGDAGIGGTLDSAATKSPASKNRLRLRRSIRSFTSCKSAIVVAGTETRSGAGGEDLDLPSATPVVAGGNLGDAGGTTVGSGASVSCCAGSDSGSPARNPSRASVECWAGGPDAIGDADGATTATSIGAHSATKSPPRNNTTAPR